MSKAIDELVLSVLKKPLAECSLPELRHLTNHYPWFSAAQVLYAKKLQVVNTALYEEQVQKTSLYFQNRLWLDHILNDNEVSPAGMNFETKGENIILPENTDPSTAVSTIENELPVAGDLEQFQETGHEESNITEARTEPSEENVTGPEPEMKIPQIKIEPIDPAQAPLTFEPYHTVDYFASQGIKFKEEDKPQDRFGQQLKSFTEWLKSMKKGPVTEMSKTAGSDTNGERKVEQMAEHSLEERNVVTEAMAEVWIKQGNKARAEEIYRKLSLLDPLKTAYFATKIEELKKTS